jgi:hypothetical protein
MKTEECMVETFVQSMDPSLQLEAFLANLVYNPDKDARRSILEASPWGNTYSISEFLNLDDFMGVIGPDTLYNVHRGTANSLDVGTDVSLAVNDLQHSIRFKRSEKASQWSVFHHGHNKITGKDRQVVEVGHSLGGTLAETIAMKHEGRRSSAFNMGTTPLVKYDSIDRTKYKHTRVKGDAVSAFDTNKGTIVLQPETGSIHDRIKNGVGPHALKRSNSTARLHGIQYISSHLNKLAQ